MCVLDRPEPEQRREDVDATVRGIRSPRIGCFNTRQSYSEEHQGGCPRKRPHRTLVHSQPGPKRKASSNFAHGCEKVPKEGIHLAELLITDAASWPQFDNSTHLQAERRFTIRRIAFSWAICKFNSVLFLLANSCHRRDAGILGLNPCMRYSISSKRKPQARAS